jgi:hypothetical protein
LEWSACRMIGSFTMFGMFRLVRLIMREKRWLISLLFYVDFARENCCSIPTSFWDDLVDTNFGDILVYEKLRTSCMDFW